MVCFEGDGVRGIVALEMLKELIIRVQQRDGLKDTHLLAERGVLLNSYPLLAILPKSMYSYVMLLITMMSDQCFGTMRKVYPIPCQSK